MTPRLHRIHPAIHATIVVLLASLSWSRPAAGNESLTLVSWGGSYARACQKAYNEPFTAETDIEVRLESYNGGLAQIRAQVETGKVYWDLVDLEMADAARGCDEGLLEPITAADLPPAPDGTPAVDDFFPDMITECGVGMLFYSTVYAYNPTHLPWPKTDDAPGLFRSGEIPRPPRHAPQPAG